MCSVEVDKFPLNVQAWVARSQVLLLWREGVCVLRPRLRPGSAAAQRVNDQWGKPLW